MRTTLRIEDDLMAELQQRARAEKLSLTKLVNRLLRTGLRAAVSNKLRGRFHQKTFRMGDSTIPFDKALAIASQFEDEEILRKLELRK